MNKFLKFVSMKNSHRKDQLFGGMNLPLSLFGIFNQSPLAEEKRHG